MLYTYDLIVNKSGQVTVNLASCLSFLTAPTSAPSSRSPAPSSGYGKGSSSGSGSGSGSQVCPPGNLRATPSDAKSFEVCVNGKEWAQFKCAQGSWFDSAQMVCTEGCKCDECQVLLLDVASSVCYWLMLLLCKDRTNQLAQFCHASILGD